MLITQCLISLKQVFKRLHLGTVSFGTDSMEEVRKLCDSFFNFLPPYTLKVEM